METREKFCIKYRVTASDMDVVYRMTPNAMLMYVQDCIANYLSSKHLAAFDIAAQRLTWMITDFEVTLLRHRPYWSEEVNVEVWISEISSIRTFISFNMLDREGRIFAQGTSTWVVMSLDTKRPCPPMSLLHDIGQDIANGKRKNSLPTSEGSTFYRSYRHEVNITDLDFNGHMCNRSYLTIATSTAPVEFIMTHEPTFFQIKFITEAFFGDILSCEVFKDAESRSFWHHIANADNKPVCEIYSRWDVSDAPGIQDIAKDIERPAPSSTAE